MKKKIIFMLLSLTICVACWSQGTLSINREEVNPQKIYHIASKMPQFPEGIEAMMKFIADSTRYPKMGHYVQGRVVLRFVVDTIGQLDDIIILRGLEPGLDEEVIRIVESMPRWIPGEQDGVKVPVYFNLPISFRLKY